MMHYLHCFFDMLAPAQCVMCGKFILHGDLGLCPSCLAILDSKRDSIQTHTEFLDKTYSVYLYEDAVRHLLLSFKDRGIMQLADIFAERMSHLILKNSLCADSLTVVPLTFKKKMSRGFNQSEILARKISKQVKIPYCSYLKVSGHKGEQKKLGKKERAKNVQDVYGCKGKELAVNSVILIDDVMTTGATLNECARILKKNGVKSVFSLTIGRVA